MSINNPIDDHHDQEARRSMNTNNGGKEIMSDESSMREEIMQHPLFKDLLAAHAACSRVTTTSSVDHFPVVAHPPLLCASMNGELDHFMASYISMLMSLEKNLRPCIREATMAFQSIEQEIFDLPGIFATEEKTNMASGPTMPTSSVKSLADMMKQELKLKLQEDYEVKIKHLWEEIKIKRAAHKLPLPSNVSSVLKKWWEEHLEWPYPTGDEKEMLMKETGLELKQLNKWFINQRNRNWNK